MRKGELSVGPRQICRGCKPLDRFPSGRALVDRWDGRRSLFGGEAAEHALPALTSKVWIVGLVRITRRKALADGVASCNFKIVAVVARAIETPLQKALTVGAPFI